MNPSIIQSSPAPAAYATSSTTSSTASSTSDSTTKAGALQIGWLGGRDGGLVVVVVAVVVVCLVVVVFVSDVLKTLSQIQ